MKFFKKSTARVLVGSMQIYSLPCTVCGTVTAGTRRKKYCGPACRVKAARYRKKEGKRRKGRERRQERRCGHPLCLPPRKRPRRSNRASEAIGPVQRIRPQAGRRPCNGEGQLPGVRARVQRDHSTSFLLISLPVSELPAIAKGTRHHGGTRPIGARRQAICANLDRRIGLPKIGWRP
jgi:hypothetical protein